MLPLIGMLAGCGTAILVGSFWPAAIAIVLTVMIIAYNGLKQTIAGPAMMGGCRTLNVLLGMSAAGEAWGKANWIVAIGVGVYVGGITWFARREAESSDRSQLVGGLLVMIAGMALVWLFPTVSTQERLTYLLQFEPWYWTLAWLLLAVLISAPFVRALANPRPENVQRAVKSGILSIIVLDAVIAFAVSGPFAAIGILLLLVPAIVLGRWIYST
jgi:4-hydroxybenzoate polyprenyltransferase